MTTLFDIIVFTLMFLLILKIHYKSANSLYFYVKSYNIKKKYINNSKFKKLNNTRLYYDLLLVFNNKNPPFHFMNNIIKSQKYYLSLAKFIDYKINSNKLKYRTINGKVLIESIAEKLANIYIKTNTPNIFKNYNQLKRKIKIRKKEDTVFKILICKYLLSYFSYTINNLFKLSYIITKAKTTSHIKKYKNTLYVQAEYYGIVKYNNNSTKILNKNISSQKFNLSSFLYALNKYQSSLINTTHYLKIMFN